ncbi:fungal-specific transcription factor domain-containing protein [Hypoxylon argillaceum]|nr:fungal-specific transcription factor domain-containing protein [Hypoxylon argillaceum]
MAGSITKDAVDGLEIDISNQENVSQRPGTLGRGSKQHVRHRASIACFSCRDRRIRCVVPKGGSGCVQCKRSGTECVIRMDDERRRPISKAYVSSLSARISMLESMLQENGIAIPPATHPPMTKHEVHSAGSGDDIRVSTIDARRRSKSGASSPIRHILSPPYSHEDFAMYEGPMEELINTEMLLPKEENFRKEHSPFRALDLKREDVMHRLFFPKGGLSCDRLSSKLRFFGATANCHVYAEPPDRCVSRDSLEKVRRAERIIRSLTPKTHDYLMQSFWKYHNSVLQVIDRVAFEADRGSENPRHYSPFLHIIILAIGWRFANKDRYDIARINLGNHESTIHREARHMLETELEGPMGIASVQALLLLGDLECGVGRDYTGWMYAGMANHLAFDLGLHVDCSKIGLPERETGVRRRVMKACVLYDRYWALFLGRPISLKSRDVALDIYKTTSSPIYSSKLSTGMSLDEQTTEQEIYEQLVELMDLASRMVENRDETLIQGTEQTASDLLALNQQLRDWYGRLPSHLKWGPDNIKAAPYSYFLLHEQYHAIIILLHRSRDAPGSLPSDRPTLGSPSSPKNTSKLSEALESSVFYTGDQAVDLHNVEALITSDCTESARTVCTQAAIQFAQIVSQSKQKHDLKKRGYTSLQPAGTASIALLAAIAHSEGEAERRLYISSLEVVTEAIQSMSRSYQPAVRMGTLIQAVLAQLNSDTRDSRPGDGDPLEQGVNGCKDDGIPQYKNTDIFSFVPARQEPCHRRQSLQTPKRPCPISTQVASESSRPLPSFHVPPSPAYTQASLDHRLNSMSGPFSTLSGLPDPSFYLDSLYSPAIGGMDNIYASRHNSDNYLRVAPSAKGWGLHSLHAASQPAQDFDTHMTDWLGESTNLAGATTLHAPPRFDSPSAVLSSGLGSDLGSKTLPGCKREDTGSLVWVNNEGGLDALTPASPKSGMQRSEKTEQNHKGNNLPTPHPNHELDYLTL